MTLNVYIQKINGFWGYNIDYIPFPAILIEDIEVTFIQNGLRIIKLHTKVNGTYEKLLSVAENLAKMIQLSEGCFHSISHVEFSVDDNESLIKNYKELRKAGLLSYYCTCSNFIRKEFTLLPPSNMITETNYKVFIKLYKNLKIQHNAFLYYCADNELPLDLRMANIIQLCEPLAFYSFNIDPKRKVSLKECIKKLVEKYGAYVFKKEIDANIFDFENEKPNGNKSILQKLVNTRVNILHYKLKPRDCFSKGAEMVVYSNKIHLLYRLTLLQLLGIEVEHSKIVKAIEYIETGSIRDFSFNEFIKNYRKP